MISATKVKKRIDPIHAAIAAAGRAWAANEEWWDLYSQADEARQLDRCKALRAAGDVARDHAFKMFYELLRVKPTTPAGGLALLKYLTEFGSGTDWPLKDFSVGLRNAAAMMAPRVG